MEGIHFMGVKMGIEVDSFQERYQGYVRSINDTLSNVDINSRLSIEKNLDCIQEEINELKKRIDNSIQLNN